MQVTTDITLTEDQREARDAILARINMGARYVSLRGFAGSGKTYLTATLAEELSETQRVYACAPTHKAAHVLGKKMPIDTQTIHSFLGLKMRRNNHGSYSLYQDDRFEMPSSGIVLLDESSMVGKVLWKYIDSSPGLQWLFVGDPAQLPPVAEPPSPALDVDGAMLKNIVRQAAGNPILRMAEKVRLGEPYLNAARFDAETGTGVFLTRDSKPFLESIIRGFKNQDGSAPPDVRVLSYRNVVVAHYNEKIRQELLGTKHPPRFAPGDWLMMQNTFFEDQVQICKNSEEVRILEARVDTYVTTGGFWKSHWLTVQRESGDIREMPILHETEAVRMKGTLAQFKDEAIRGERPWQDYYTLLESFAQADHAYAMTVHKCVSPDTLVETPRGLEPISEISKTGWIAGPKGMRTYRNKVVNTIGKALSIQTRNGFRLVVTPEHGLDVWDGSQYVRKEANDLCPGEMLRFRRGATIWPTEYVELPPSPVNMDVRAVEYSIPRLLTEDVAELLGFIVADGCVYKSGFRLVKRHKEVRDRFAELCESIFGVNPDKPDRFQNAFAAEVYSVQLSKWLLQIHGVAPNQKDVPDVVLRSPLSVQQAFMRGLIEDGGVNLTDNKFDHVELAQKSDTMLHRLQVMLLRMGIVAHYRKYQGGIPRLYFYGSEAVALREQIGFTSPEKARRLSLCNGKPLVSHKVPISAGEVDHLRKDHPTSFKAPWVSNDAKIKGYLSRRMAIDVATRSNSCAPWLDERLEYHHEEIDSITEVVSPSMCVEVPDGHQFFQNGCVGWNSQGSTFHTAYVEHRDLLACKGPERRALIYVAVTRPSHRLAMLI